MPMVSVILPVYNGEKYLAEAINSILNQTFSDYELLIINDGSVDNSENIILSFNDRRITYVKNKENKGLIYSLNKAIEQAKGKYIARMDADDISLPERLQCQVEFLEKTDVAILATRVKLIDDKGDPLPDWEDDLKNTTPGQIKKFLLKDNCIAHPTVMGRASLFQTYKYRENQKYSEDYDLWLRIIADGRVIEKLTKPLLLHRILPTSETRFKKINTYFRLAKVKLRFLQQQVKQGSYSSFVAKVFLFGVIDLIKAGGKELKGAIVK